VGEVILFEQYSLLRRTWLWVLLGAVLVTGAVAVYYFTAVPVQYSATVRVLPPNKSGTPLDNLLGGVASTLKDFGLSRLVSKAGSATGYAPAVVFTSTRLYDSLTTAFDLHRQYDIPLERRDLVYAELADNLDVVLDEDGPVVVTVFDTEPRRAVAMADSIVSYTNSIAQDLNRRETEPITTYIGRQLELKQQEQKEVASRLSSFLVTHRLFDPEGQSAAISTAIFKAEAEVSAQREAYELFKSNLGETDPKTVQAAERLRIAERAAARLRTGEGSVVAGPPLEKLPGGSVEYANLRLQYEAVSKYLAILEPMYEQSRFDEIRNIPVFNVLDPPHLPMKKARPKRSIIIASTFVGTLLLCYMGIALWAYWRGFTARYRAYSGRAQTSRSQSLEPGSDER